MFRLGVWRDYSNMSNCTCTNCIFIDGGRRYCYDCEKYTVMPTTEELNRKIQEMRYLKAKGEIQDA